MWRPKEASLYHPQWNYLLPCCLLSVVQWIRFKAAGCAAGEGRQLPIKGLFYGIGHQPNSSIVQGQVELDDKGYVVVSSQLLARTSITTDSRCRLPKLTGGGVDASSLPQPAVAGSAAQPRPA